MKVIPEKTIEILKLFNSKAEKIINSSFKNEIKNKDVGETLKWELDDKTQELKFDYSVVNHNEDFINSVLMPLRLFVQNNESISIGNMANIYENIPIDEKYKNAFRKIRHELNTFLDEPAKTLLDDNPTRRQLFETVLYGEIAHLTKDNRKILEKWQSDKVVWDLAYIEFQRIIHDYIFAIHLMHELNTRIMKDHEQEKT